MMSLLFLLSLAAAVFEAPEEFLSRVAPVFGPALIGRDVTPEAGRQLFVNGTVSEDQTLTTDDVSFLCSLCSIRAETLRAGRNSGSTLITLRTAVMEIALSPTRGSNILYARTNDSPSIYLGWASPISSVLNPLYQDDFCEGFNEFVARNGYTNAGPESVEDNEVLVAGGEASSNAAQTIWAGTSGDSLVVESKYEYTVIGGPNFLMTSQLKLAPDELGFTITDILTNRDAYEHEYMAIYRNTLGVVPTWSKSPMHALMGAGATLHIPCRQIWAHDQVSLENISSWGDIPGPTRHYGELVYDIYPLFTPDGRTMAIFVNPDGNVGLVVTWTESMPVFTFRKRAELIDNGYYVGLEPGSSFHYTRQQNREIGLTPKLRSQQSVALSLSYKLLTNVSQVQTYLNWMQSNFEPENVVEHELIFKNPSVEPPVIPERGSRNFFSPVLILPIVAYWGVELNYLTFN